MPRCASGWWSLGAEAQKHPPISQARCGSKPRSPMSLTPLDPQHWSATQLGAFQFASPATLAVPCAKNVILVLTDDSPPWRTHSALHNLEAHGAPDPFGNFLYAQIPWHEWLAARGKVFHHVVGAPVCSPSRMSILLGLRSVRHGAGQVIGEHNAGGLVEFRDPGWEGNAGTLFERLRARGIYTGAIGKLHLSLPLGADTVPPSGHSGIGFGVLDRLGNPDFARVCLRNLGQTTFVGQSLLKLGYSKWWKHDSASGLITQQHGWATDVQADDLIDFVQSAAGQPFFAFWQASSQHAPFDWPGDGRVYTQQYRDWHASFNGGAGTGFANQQGQQEDFDRNLGRVIQSLPAHELAQTLFIVLSDNGFVSPVLESAVSDHGKSWGSWDALLSGRMKGTTYRWGAHCQMIVAGPGVTPKNTISRALIDLPDLFPTILRHFDTEHAETDGIDFSPTLHADVPIGAHARQTQVSDWFVPRGDAAQASDRRQRAVRWKPESGLWSLVLRKGRPPELYQLYDQAHAEVDPHEFVDLARSEPAITAELLADLALDDARVLAPGP